MSALSVIGLGSKHMLPRFTLHTVASAFALLARNCLLLIPPKRPSRWPPQCILKMTVASLVSSPERRWPGFMLISGVWHSCDDGIVRPVIRAEVLSGNGSWVKTLFLLDTGADRTVFSVDILRALRLPSVAEDQV